MLGAVVLLEGFLDGSLRRNDRLHVKAGHELDVVHREHIGGIGGRDGQRAPDTAERNDQVLLGDLGRNQLDDGRVDLEVGEIYRGNAVLTAQHGGYVVIVDETQGNENRTETPAVVPLVLQRDLQLFGRYKILFDEELTDVRGHS